MIRAAAAIARTGIQRYVTSDGDVLLEFRSEEEVFSKDTMESFNQVPVTDDHPSEPVTADNYKQYSVGSVSALAREGDLVTADVLIADAKAIESVMAGKKEVSCGYTCDVVKEDGVWQGQRYTHVQKNIRGNHLAIVQKGRAGDRVRLRIDSAHEVIDNGVDSQPTNKEVKMAIVTFEGKELEVSEDAKAAIEALVLKADASEKKASEEMFAARVEKRVALKEKASKIVSKDVKLDGMSDIEIMRKAISTVKPSLVLDGKSNDAIEAIFEMLDIPVEKVAVKADAVNVVADELAVAKVVAEPIVVGKKSLAEMHKLYYTPKGDK